MSCQVKCSKGSGASDSTILEFEGKDLSVTDPESQSFLSLKEIRDRLVSEKFIGKDGDQVVWRFVVKTVMPDEKEKIRYSDRIIGTNVEELYPAKKLIINQENEIILTNVEKAGKPDLIGFATDYFNNGKLEVTCRLRDYMEGDKAANKGKFQPLMLTDVISTREEDDINYKFVCVCCEDSILEFPVKSFGEVGFVIRADVDNTTIYDSARHYKRYTSNFYGEGTVNCMKRPGEERVRNITVKNLSKDTGVPVGSGIRYQKITIYTRNMLSWYDIGSKTTFTAASKPPKEKNNTNLKAAPIALLNSVRKEQIELPSDSYSPGKIEEGSPVVFKHGGWYRGTEAPGILGSVSIYMFVFNTLEDAEKVIGRYNRLTESRQAEFWGLK